MAVNNDAIFVFVCFRFIISLMKGGVMDRKPIVIFMFVFLKDLQQSKGAS